MEGRPRGGCPDLRLGPAGTSSHPGLLLTHQLVRPSPLCRLSSCPACRDPGLEERNLLMPRSGFWSLEGGREPGNSSL